MRIIGGLYRHRLIDFPNTGKTRPTKDMVRQGIFNALSQDIYGKSVLDLYAGSGAMGIEAISRGATNATFVDRDLAAISCIKKNLISLQIEKGEVLGIDAQKALDLFICKKRSFDLIFLDPPYAEKVFEQLIGRFLNEGLLAQNGIIVIENEDPIVIETVQFRKVKNYRYGITNVTILWR